MLSKFTGMLGVGATGALISDDAARDLSLRLCSLGDQWEAICEELAAAGYGVQAALKRQALEIAAGSEENRSRLRAYWREWAKERMAGLVGPMNILKGRYPPNSVYRSALMAQLRADVAAGKIVSEGPTKSPQIEPTLKRDCESGIDNPAFKRLHEEIKSAQREATAALRLVDTLNSASSMRLPVMTC